MTVSGSEKESLRRVGSLLELDVNGVDYSLR